jgi:hypothetical protein
MFVARRDDNPVSSSRALLLEETKAMQFVEQL